MRRITKKCIDEYILRVEKGEKSKATAIKYRRAISSLYKFAYGENAGRETVLNWKEHISSKYSPGTVNAFISAANGFLEFCGYQDCKMKPLKTQRNIFRDEKRELSKGEYLRLVETAKRTGNERLKLIMETLGSTGIRISELRFITLEAVINGKAIVNCKGKQRPVLIPKALRKMLKKYANKKGISTGSLFITSKGNPVDRSNIWKEMKRLCEKAGVLAGKVFPHNFRHLFAVIYYKTYKDIAKLADLLGHSSINTTRIYLMESGQTHEKQIESLGLIL